MNELAAMLGGAVLAGGTSAAVLWGLLRWEAALPQDVANGRSLHAGSMPRVGGVAIAAGLACSLWLRFLWVGESTGVHGVLMAAAGLLAVLSFADDCRTLPVTPRLIGHLAAAVVVVVALDVPWQLAVPLALAVVWMTNLYNFMDGADGLAGLMTLIGFCAYAIAAWPVAPALAGCCLSVAAAAAGFLGFNFPPARVFMGDAGSIPLGFLAASIGLAGWQGAIWPAWFPVLVFLPFVADATVTLGQRLVAGEAIWQAHHNHYYQRLVRMGWSHRRVAFTGAVAMTITAGGALGMLSLDSGGRILGLMAWALAYAFALHRIDNNWRRNVASLNQ